MTYEELVKAGYWTGGTQAYKDRCTCPHPTREDEFGKVHNYGCPRWVSEHVRRAQANRGVAKDMTNG